ncbi:iron uptake porin [Oscillatoria sp. CS-180]|uniref:iron uptake porin n=1 Tax=Oscillatoria sp. CS-180 TaxID=3021720 RepID=UPI00232C3817|nr:iron uptake porin [Oscillatoria sp. CS-180]MDB9527650.1 iron uptake porin [Oscillatoria sp. CS-180]
MSNKLWKVLLASPAVLGMGFAGSAVAAEATGVDALENSQESVELAQVSTIDELIDVSPTDWAFAALESLVEDYACIEGDFGTNTYRGNQFMTRYEFAAGLNKCLDSIRFLLADGGVDLEGLETIQRLQEEFAAELATLRGRVDALEAETEELRAQQFSTTTKLRGQVDGNLVVPFGELNDEDDDVTTFNARARLNFDASFTGEDRLRVRLQSGDDDFGALGAAGGLANSTSDASTDTGGQTVSGFNVDIDDLYYSFGVGDNLDFIIAANSIATDDFVTSTIVPFDGPSVADPGGPVGYDFDMGGGGFAVGGSIGLGDNFVIDAGYSGDQGNSGTNDTDDGGIFGANSQSYIVQGSFLSDGLIDAAVAYLHGNDGGDNDFTDTFMGLLNLDFGNFFLAGYFAFHDNGDDDDTSFQFGGGFDDLLFEGSEFGVYYADLADYDDDPYMIEGYLAIPVNQYLTLTPAVIYGDLGDGDDDENFYGALRATFSF